MSIETAVGPQAGAQAGAEAGAEAATVAAAGTEWDSGQPYAYRQVALVEPDWTRFPGWQDVTEVEWRSAQWQRSHCVKSVKQLRAVMGDLLDERFYADLERDQAERATMSMLVPPQMLNTMAPGTRPAGPGSLTDAFYADPVRGYMLPVFSDRRTDWPSHPHATRDSLHEHDMWAVEGLTHRYPTKVLAELLPTCPQYCGHCTRMDLVGNSTPQVQKLKLVGKPDDRLGAMLDYLRRNPGVRDVVVSGGDVANMPIARLEDFLTRLLEIDNIRDIRLATKALMGMPQHWLQDDVRAGVERVATLARSRGVSLAIHTHVNHASSVTPLVAEATRAMFDAGVRDVRNQGVLLSGVNADPGSLLDLCFALLDGAGIMPYYFYMCDMIPFSEHWRVSVADAQRLQHHIMGYLPGFATPRIVCDVPFVGKRWVHQLADYDRERGISYWTKNYRTSIEATDPEALTRTYEYYDPIHTLPEAGQRWWAEHGRLDESALKAAEVAEASRRTAALQAH
jgi:lysine 2,3-aminomutase